MNPACYILNFHHIWWCDYYHEKWLPLTVAYMSLLSTGNFFTKTQRTCLWYSHLQNTKKETDNTDKTSTASLIQNSQNPFSNLNLYIYHHLQCYLYSQPDWKALYHSELSKIKENLPKHAFHVQESSWKLNHMKTVTSPIYINTILIADHGSTKTSY